MKNLSLSILIMVSLVINAIANPTVVPTKKHNQTSVGAFLNTDGTLNLTENFSGSLSLKGFKVYIDDKKGIVAKSTSANNPWSTLGTGTDGTVTAIAVNGNKVYVGGNFQKAGGITVNGIAMWNGNKWSALGSGFNIRYNFDCKIIVSRGQEVYVGGSFIEIGGVKTNHIAKWNGRSWSAVGSGLPEEGIVSAMAFSRGDIYVGGSFEKAGGVTVNGIAKLKGGSWSAVGSALPQGSSVNAIAIRGRKVYIGGQFEKAGGFNIDGIAQLNGRSWSALGSGLGEYASVNSIVISGLDVYVGGTFEKAGGKVVNNIAKWNGSSWSALGEGLTDKQSDEPYAFCSAIAFSNGVLYAQGKFTGSGVARWDGRKWSDMSTEDYFMNTYEHRAIAASGNDVYLGGARYYIRDEKTSKELRDNSIIKWSKSSTAKASTNKPNSESLFNENKYYRLTTRWQGERKSLDIINDGKNNQPVLAKTGNYSGQMWKIKKVGEGIYRLSTRWQGDNKVLGCASGKNQNRPVLNQKSGQAGNTWYITSLGGGYYRIANVQLRDKSLDIINDGKNNKIQVAKTGNYSGQYWKITEF